MTDSAAPDDRRASARGPDRRRHNWSSFRSAYPTFLKITGLVLLILVGADLWLAYERRAYGGEVARLRSGMTDAERKKSDLVVQSEQDKMRLTLELAKRQAHIDSKLHLSIAVDSGVMYFERDGALLRVMRVAVAPAALPKVQGDTTSATLPRGERTVTRIIDDSGNTVLVLNGDTRIYAGAATDTITAGNVRVDPSDLKAILPNISAGMPVYFY